MQSVAADGKQEKDPRVLVIWDFDWSLMNENSDTWVVEQLGPELIPEFRSLHKEGLGWTQIMNSQMRNLWSKGVTEAEIRLSMAQLPVQSMMFDAACLASKAGAEQAIVSDANEVFINNVLSHHGLNPLFNQGVHTNGGAFTEDGRLDVHPYCPVDAPHGCNLCPPNMCKGSIVDGLLRGSSGKAERIFDTVIYVGDGGGDFCPTLRLRERDLVLARGGGTSGKKYGLYQRIQKRAVSLGMSSASKELGYWPQSCIVVGGGLGGAEDGGGVRAGATGHKVGKPSGLSSAHGDACVEAGAQTRVEEILGVSRGMELQLPCRLEVWDTGEDVFGILEREMERLFSGKKGHGQCDSSRVAKTSEA